MTDASCSECGKAKTSFHCGLCKCLLCKKCTSFLPEDRCLFLDQKPPELMHPTYCGACFDGPVGEHIALYDEILTRAKKVVIFFKTQKKNIPLILKSKEILSLKNQADRDQLILKLAFFAAKLNFNAVIEVDIHSERIQNKSRAYQFNRWHGSGTAAQIDLEKLAKIEALNQKGQKI